VITGKTKQGNLICQGFTYVELLISFLLLGSGVLAFVMLLARNELMQSQSNQTLDAMLMADYMAAQLSLSSKNCNANHHCLFNKIELGTFDANSSLLEGFGWSTLTRANSASAIGCLRYDTTTGIFSIAIFHKDLTRLDSEQLDCTDPFNRYKYILQYPSYFSLSRSTNE